MYLYTFCALDTYPSVGSYNVSYKSDIVGYSVSLFTDPFLSYSTASSCASSCDKSKYCVAFVYSVSLKTCQLKFSARISTTNTASSDAYSLVVTSNKANITSDMLKLGFIMQPGMTYAGATVIKKFANVTAVVCADYCTKSINPTCTLFVTNGIENSNCVLFSTFSTASKQSNAVLISFVYASNKLTSLNSEPYKIISSVAGLY